MNKLFLKSIIVALVLTMISPLSIVVALEDEIVYDQPVVFSETYEIVENVNQRGQISTSKLRLTVSVIKAYKSDSSLSNVSIQYNYKWLSEPLYRWSDGLTMTWDNSNLRFKDESFTKKDYYFNDVLKKQVLFTHEKTPSELSSQGIGWYADLAGWHLTPKNSEGYGHFLLVPKKTIKTGSIQLYANYAHALAGGIGISIKGVSVSFAGSHDNQATSKTINLQRGKV